MEGSTSETPIPCAAFQFNPHRKSHLRSHTHSTLLRILSHCHEHSHCSHGDPDPDHDSSGLERLTENEVGNELVAADNVEPEDMPIQKDPTVRESPEGLTIQNDPIVDESAKAIGCQEVGLSNVPVIIDDSEQITRGEGNNDVVADKNNSSLILSLEKNQNNISRELESLMAKKEDNEAVAGKIISFLTSELDENQNADHVDTWMKEHADFFDLQHVFVEEEADGEQVYASNEQNNFVNLEGLNLSVDDYINGEDSKADKNNSEKGFPLKEAATEDLGLKLLQKEMELKKPVSPKTVSSPLYVAVDGDIEEGQISGEFMDDDIPIKDDEASEMKKGAVESNSENINNKEEFTCTEQKRVNDNDSESTPKIISSVDKLDNEVKVTENKRKQKRCKSQMGHGGRTINGAKRTAGSGFTRKAETSKMKGRAAEVDFDCPANFLDDLAFHGAENLSIASVKEGTGVTKKRKRELAKERRAKNKQKERKKPAEKSSGLGVKRLKLPPASEPKTVKYCNHYLKGKCLKGAQCRFSHDTIPLTKSKPCKHLAKGGCMKGDDCPYDHQLSKYSCDQYASKGFCSRSNDCLFSHKMPPKEGSPNFSRLKQVDLVPKMDEGVKVNNQTNLGEVQNMNEKAKRAPVTVPPRGINFLVFGKASLNDSSVKELVGSPSNREDGNKISPLGDSNTCKQVGSSSTRDSSININNQLNQSGTETFHKLNNTSNRKQPAMAPSGINFRGSCKASLDDMSSKRQSKSPSKSDSLLETSIQERLRASIRFQNPSAVRLPASPFTSDSDQLVHGHNKDASSSAQKALSSMLAFAGKYESALKMDQSIVATTSAHMEANKQIKNVSNSGDSRNKAMKASTILGFLYGSGGKTK